MSKVRANITLDKEVHEKVKESKLNLSGFINSILKEIFNERDKR